MGSGKGDALHFDSRRPLTLSDILACQRLSANAQDAEAWVTLIASRAGVPVSTVMQLPVTELEGVVQRMVASMQESALLQALSQRWGRTPTPEHDD